MKKTSEEYNNIFTNILKKIEKQKQLKISKKEYNKTKKDRRKIPAKEETFNTYFFRKKENGATFKQIQLFLEKEELEIMQKLIFIK